MCMWVSIELNKSNYEAQVHQKDNVKWITYKYEMHLAPGTKMEKAQVSLWLFSVWIAFNSSSFFLCCCYNCFSSFSFLCECIFGLLHPENTTPISSCLFWKADYFTCIQLQQFSTNKFNGCMVAICTFSLFSSCIRFISGKWHLLGGWWCAHFSCWNAFVTWQNRKIY